MRGVTLSAWIDGCQGKDVSMQADQRMLEFILQPSRGSSTPAPRPWSVSRSATPWRPGLAQVSKAVADPVRLRLVFLIGARQRGEACVCELTTAFSLAQPTISHHRVGPRVFRCPFGLAPVTLGWRQAAHQ
jgi:hypothetical protein